MIRPTGEAITVMLCLEPVDFRKQIPGLAAIVEGDLAYDPFAPVIYGFTNKRRDHCRLLAWENSGFVLWAKKLEKARFHWPKPQSPTCSLTVQELNWLLDGMNLANWQPHASLHFESVV